MTAFFKRYNDQIIILLIGIILALLLILLTDIHIARINRNIRQTIHQTF